MSGDIYVIAENNVLVTNRVSNGSRIGNDGILEEDTVLNDSTLSDSDAAEEDTVFNSTFDHTAVCDQRVLNLGGFAVISGSGVADLREDRSFLNTEERIEHFLIFDQLHIVCVIILEGRNASEITVVSVGTEVSHVKALEEYVARNAGVAVRDGVKNDILQIFAVQNDDIQADVSVTVKIGRIHEHIGDSAFLAGENDRVGSRHCAVEIHALNCDRNVRTVCDMVVDHVVEVDIADDVTVSHYHVIGGQLRDGVADALERFQSGVRKVRSHVRIEIDVGRKNLDTAGTASEVPVLTGSDMVHERVVIVLRDDVDIADVGIHHVGERKVDETVAASERNGREGTDSRKLRNFIIVKIRKNNTCYRHFHYLLKQYNL